MHIHTFSRNPFDQEHLLLRFSVEARPEMSPRDRDVQALHEKTHADLDGMRMDPDQLLNGAVDSLDVGTVVGRFQHETAKKALATLSQEQKRELVGGFAATWKVFGTEFTNYGLNRPDWKASRFNREGIEFALTSMRPLFMPMMLGGSVSQPLMSKLGIVRVSSKEDPSVMAAVRTIVDRVEQTLTPAQKEAQKRFDDEAERLVNTGPIPEAVEKELRGDTEREGTDEDRREQRREARAKTLGIDYSRELRTFADTYDTGLVLRQLDRVRKNGMAVVLEDAQGRRLANPNAPQGATLKLTDAPVPPAVLGKLFATLQPPVTRVGSEWVLKGATLEQMQRFLHALESAKQPAFLEKDRQKRSPKETVVRGAFNAASGRLETGQA